MIVEHRHIVRSRARIIMLIVFDEDDDEDEESRHGSEGGGAETNAGMTHARTVRQIRPNRFGPDTETETDRIASSGVHQVLGPQSQKTVRPFPNEQMSGAVVVVVLRM